jgi:hypothetical protein
MARTRAAQFRVLVVCTLIVCMLLVSASLACGIHEHSVSHCCDFCHFGLLPWVQAASHPRILPPFERQWRARSDENRHAVEPASIASSSRAPPVC